MQVTMKTTIERIFKTDADAATTGKTLPTTCEKCATTNGNAAGGIVDRKGHETPPQSPQTPNGGNKTGGSDSDRCMKWCAEHRVSETVKLCLAMKQLRKDYIAYLAKDLKPDHIQKVIDQAHEFHDSIATKFQVMWYTLNGEWQKTYPD